MADNKTTPERDNNTPDPIDRPKVERDRPVEHDYERHGGEDAGGITNRPLDEEIANQQAVPDRGSRKDEDR